MDLWCALAVVSFDFYRFRVGKAHYFSGDLKLALWKFRH